MLSLVGTFMFLRRFSFSSPLWRQSPVASLNKIQKKRYTTTQWYWMRRKIVHCLTALPDHMKSQNQNVQDVIKDMISWNTLVLNRKDWNINYNLSHNSGFYVQQWGILSFFVNNSTIMGPLHIPRVLQVWRVLLNEIWIVASIINTYNIIYYDRACCAMNSNAFFISVPITFHHINTPDSSNLTKIYSLTLSQVMHSPINSFCSPFFVPVGVDVSRGLRRFERGFRLIVERPLLILNDRLRLCGVGMIAAESVNNQNFFKICEEKTPRKMRKQFVDTLHLSKLRGKIVYTVDR